MIRTLRRAALVLSLSVLATSPAYAGDLAIDLSGIRVAEGHLMVSLVDSAAGWDDQAPPRQATRVAAVEGTTRVVFENVSPGTYGVMVLHDENDNGKLDTNIVGMPIEGYGFSNNPRVMRKPTWAEARFELAADGATIAIALR
ncbi:DUF2141 domain-containing protein [Luteimonas aestuarii]|uniref:DUF2141 domain-containing protein n=1 Tax=Luteimonas aestuarii TaxID=453837 RepID=A0A4R5TRN3_9GAMM|nr:DUF2141 domain-containing protein [Luteimonas aestuarii]TDK23735.1 DUF2141 domain-containing protein [Luteimonas aestuarii]